MLKLTQPGMHGGRLAPELNHQGAGFRAVTSPVLGGAQAGDSGRLVSWSSGGSSPELPKQTFPVGRLHHAHSSLPSAQGSRDEASRAKGSNTTYQVQGPALHFCVIRRVLLGERGTLGSQGEQKGLSTSLAQRQTCSNSLLSAEVTVRSPLQRSPCCG